MAIWTLVFQRLVPLLLGGSGYGWQINDLLRCASFAAFAAWGVFYVPWGQLRTKCLLAAVFGYSVADLLVSIVWYTWRPFGYATVCAAQLAGFVVMAVWYYRRSYDQPTIAPEPSHLYCLRHRPTNLQDLIISMCGVFGADGAYSIYCDGFVYGFRHGTLTRVKYHHSEYHSVIGCAVTERHRRALNAMCGTKWQLIGANCLTTLAYFWNRYCVR